MSIKYAINYQRMFSPVGTALACTLLLFACSSGLSDPEAPISGTNDPANGPADSTVLMDGASCAEALGAGELAITTTLINTSSACDYYLTGDLTITSRLTIEPGTTIIAAANARMRIDNGSLQAVGTASAPITFQGESNATGSWQGITLRDTRPSRIEFVNIKDAGQVGRIRSNIHAALDIYNSTVSLINVSVSNSYVNGASLEGKSALSAFASNRFFNNELAGLTLSPDLVEQLDVASDYIGDAAPNGIPAIEVHGEFSSIIQQNPINNATWKALNAPYRIVSQLGLTEEVEQLTLEPGVEIITLEDIYFPIYIYNGGQLIAKGTADNPITFTAGVDDPNRHSFDIGTDGTVLLDHVSINGYDNGIVIGGGSATVSNTVFNVATGFGIKCERNDVRDNALILGENVTASANATALLDPNCP